MDKRIPLEKLESVLDDIFSTLSDGEKSEDEYESDEHDNECVFNEPLNEQQLLDILEPGSSIQSSSRDLTEINPPANIVDILEPGSSTQSSSRDLNEINPPANIVDLDDIPLSELRSRRRNRQIDQEELFSETDDDEDDEWKKAPLPHTVPQDIFDRDSLCSSQIFPIRSGPLAYFRYLFPDEVVSNLVEQSNLYAVQENRRNWDPVIITEMEAWLGMLILMGVHPLANIDLYWSSDPLFRVEEIADVMTCKRFKQILRNLHINDNSQMPKKGEPGHDKLYKIRPMLDKLSTNFQIAAKCSSSQSIDECMIKFKGRSSLKQYLPKKPTKRGFKVWARCDSHTGYLYEFEVYTGKKTDVVETGLGASVVKHLCKSFVDQNMINIHVAFDNFFSSKELMQDLYEQKIYSTATVRSNRKNLPKIVKSKELQKLEKGESKWRVNGNVGFFVWHDTKLVYILSTAFPPYKQDICMRTQKDGKKKEVNCPVGVLEYTKRMGGVDRFDHKRGNYTVARKSRRWWLRIFYFLIDAAITNSYILYTQNPRVRYPMTIFQFRTILGRDMIGNFSKRKRRISSLPNFITKKPKVTSRQKNVHGVPDSLRLSDVGVHMPVSIPTSYRRCRLCSTKSVSKKTKIQCAKCQVPLCAVPCFANFHAP